MTLEGASTADGLCGSGGPGLLQSLVTAERDGYENLYKELSMAFVVTQPCFGCKYTDCVVVCPTDCFREGEKMLYIDPDPCIDCGACEPECPVSAIFFEDNVPEDQRPFIQLNAEMSLACPSITVKKQPL